MLPNFLIIGAMKSGTTSLYAYLREHPEIGMPVIKEPNFFSDNSVWAKGVKWYESLFANCQDNKVIGEASVNYTKYPYYKDVPKRIFSLIPQVKLIYVLRSPIERIYSHYMHNVFAGIEHDPIEKAIFEKPLYIHTSLYYTQIEQFLQYFPRENLMVFLFDDLKRDPLGTVRNIFAFLGVDSSFIPPNIHEVKHRTKMKKGVDNFIMKVLRRQRFYSLLTNKLPEGLKLAGAVFLKKKISEPGPMTDRLHDELLSIISPDMSRLACFLGRDLSCWNLQKRH